MGKSVILFSGVHGVGKGYFISKNLKEKDNFICFGASALIQLYRNSEDAGYKKVRNVSGNQEILLEALKQAKMSVDKHILLDGHLCIINSDDKIERIPESFILEAPIKGIVLLQESSSIVSQRQQLRDGNAISNKMINMIQYEEKNYAKLLSEKYQIPFEIISSKCERDEFLRIINEMEVES
jgi:adenylate kinase